MVFGCLGLVRPGAAQEPPDSLPVCTVGGALDGVVIDRVTRVPLAASDVVASLTERTLRTRSSARGRFRFCGIPAGARVRLRATARSVQGEARVIAGENRSEPVALSVDLGVPSRVIVSVTDASTGDPVGGATLRLEPGVIGGVTNEQGSVGLGRVPPGDYRLRADHLAYRPFDGPAFVVPDEPLQLAVVLTPRAIALDTIDVRVEGNACAPPGFTTVSGTVVDRRTRLPLRGAIVSATRFGEQGLEEERTQAGAQGSFVLCGMPEDTRFRLQADLGSLRSEGLIVTTGDERGAIVLEIDHGQPAFLLMRVVDASTGFPVEGAMIRLRPHPLGGISDDRGRAGFREVPPGEYDVRVDHIAYASFEGTVQVGERSAEEYEIELRPTAIAVEPIEVKITGRDPVLVNTGFYDRMAGLDEGYFYDYWDAEPYALLSTFLNFKTFLAPAAVTFLNGKPITRLGYESVDEIPFGEIRGVEHIRCADLPQDHARYFDGFAIEAARHARGHSDCWALLIWRGEGRVRQQRDQPTGRCANERRAEEACGAGPDG